MKQLKVSLPDDLRAELETASTEGGRSLGEEIRRRIERTIWEDRSFDAKTRDLADDVMMFAAQVQANGGIQWHVHPAAYEAFVVAIDTWLEMLRPQPLESAAVSDLFGPVDPQTLGRTLARSWSGVKGSMPAVLDALRNRKADKS